MAELPKIASNCLSHLLGDYNSDSENDDNGGAADNMDQTMDKFFTELNTEHTKVTTNWTQCYDKNTGHPYYWNTLSKDVTWEMPAEYQTFLDSNSAATGKRKESTWTTCYTDDEATPYYVNEVTRIVSWDRPDGLLDDPPRAKVHVEATQSVVAPTLKKSSPKSVKPSRSINAESKAVKVKRRKYPFDNDNFEQEKIELISSYTTMSDSSSDEDAAKKKKTSDDEKALKLVATEYNSDDNSDDGTKKPHAGNKPSSKSRKANTFASIITGGRSPEHVQNLADDHRTTETPPQIAAIDNIEEIELNVKAFKRKRRIEFKKQPIVRTASETEETDAPNAAKNDGSSVAIDAAVLKPYANFQKAESVGLTDVTEEAEQEAKPAAVPSESDNHSANTDQRKVSDDIQVLKLIIEAKLKFLCDGRPDVSPVQAIMIQLETLLEAFDEGALQPDYIQRWLAGISNDLLTLEKDAAPDGWKCLWNRKNSQYCYKNLTTGEILWEYPDTMGTATSASTAKTDDDEMDICTTPPPNVEEQLHVVQGSVKKLKDIGTKTPKPPKWDVVTEPIAPPPPQISDEPLPPGIDAVEFSCAELAPPTPNKPSEMINSELASFYSDLASIDSVSEAAVSGDKAAAQLVAADSTMPSEENANADANKKKKRKIKKLQPWRSGNLETWISKWQKAQKELDN